MIPLAALKAALKIEEDQTADDAYLVELEAEAVAHCERVTGRRFGAPAMVTETVAGTGQRELWLSNEPALDPAPAVSIDGVAATAPVTVRGRTLLLGVPPGASGWGNGYTPADVVVTYTAGYAAGQEPPDVRQAVRQLVAMWYEQRLPVALGTVAPPVPHAVADLLAPFRVMRL